LNILFDLDDTLLENPMESFIPAYLHRLSEQLKAYVSPDLVPKLILKGTDYMVENVNPTMTLEENFDKYFYPKLGSSKNLVIDQINDFYENEFPKLSIYTSQIPQASSIIRYLIQEKHQIIIATNPLFPKKAIDHRINWANLGLDLDVFRYITNYEQFHFAKPRPEFLAEILGKIGWPEEPVAMIGNDWDQDIRPAAILGIPTFFLGTPPPQPDFDLHPMSSSGNLSQVVDWICNFEINKVSIEYKATKAALVAIMRATAANFDSFRRNSDLKTYYSLRPQPEEWSLVEIFSHMADVDSEVNLPRLDMIQNETNPFIQAALTDDWAEERLYINNDPIVQIERFIKNRINLINLIDGMDDSIWNKKVNHAIFGPTPTSELINFIAQHDRIHINQIMKTIIQLQSK